MQIKAWWMHALTDSMVVKAHGHSPYLRSRPCWHRQWILPALAGIYQKGACLHASARARGNTLTKGIPRHQDVGVPWSAAKPVQAPPTREIVPRQRLGATVWKRRSLRPVRSLVSRSSSCLRALCGKLVAPDCGCAHALQLPCAPGWTAVA